MAAGPGSGKTKVIVERIKYLIEQGLKPSDMFLPLQERIQYDKYYEIRNHFELETKEVAQFIVKHIEEHGPSKLLKNKVYIYLKSLSEKPSGLENANAIVVHLTNISLAMAGVFPKVCQSFPSVALVKFLEQTHLFPFIANHLLSLCELVGISMPIGYDSFLYTRSQFNKSIENKITFDFYLVYRSLEQEKWRNGLMRIPDLGKWHDDEMISLAVIGKKNLHSYEKTLSKEQQKKILEQEPDAD